MPKRPSFEPLKAKGRNAKWVVNLPAKYSESGRRERHYFQSKQSAQSYCDQVKTKIENYGSKAQLLTPSEVEQAVQAFEKIKPYRVPLNAVVEEWILRRKQADASVTFLNLMDEFAQAGRKKRKRSVGYRRSINQVSARMASLHTKKVSEITAVEIETAVDGMTSSVRNYSLRILSCAFNLAVRRGWSAANPLVKVEQDAIERKEIQIYLPRQVKRILVAAEKYDRELIPFLAISFFAGVRRSEVIRMDWKNVELPEKFIKLPIQVTKTKQGRNIPIEPNLLEWLRPYSSAEGPVAPFSESILRKKERQLRLKHRVPAIKHGPRHCYGTYWLAAHEKIDRLMLSMGHTDFETTQEHYAKAATKKSADLYWRIVPIKRPRQEKSGPKT